MCVYFFLLIFETQGSVDSWTKKQSEQLLANQFGGFVWNWFDLEWQVKFNQFGHWRYFEWQVKLNRFGVAVDIEWISSDSWHWMDWEWLVTLGSFSCHSWIWIDLDRQLNWIWISIEWQLNDSSIEWQCLNDNWMTAACLPLRILVVKIDVIHMSLLNGQVKFGNIKNQLITKYLDKVSQHGC